MTPKKKQIEVDRKRLPLKSILHGKEIREAAQALEQFRLELNEKEIMYGCTLTIVMRDYGEAHLVARRMETDEEWMNRCEKARLAAERKKEREAKRKLADREKMRKMLEAKKQEAREYIGKIDQKLQELVDSGEV